MALDVPKLSFPFRLSESGRSVMVVEQNSDDEILDCVEVLLSTERGERLEVPDYGVPDQSFLQGGVDVNDLVGAVARWEPRATVMIQQTEFRDLLQRLRIAVGGGTSA